jgi:nucleoside-triphosphatase THEP1
MAGAFGYEKENDHYEVAVAAGERMLLPEVRNARNDELIIADGFSCQEQIEQQTNRAALHTAQVLQMALHNRDGEISRGRPEAQMLVARKRAQRIAMTRTLIGLGIGVAAGIMAIRMAANRRGQKQLLPRRQ